MSAARLPVLVCDGERCAERAVPVTMPARWLGETTADLRRSAAAYGWQRKGSRDLCPHCAGAYDARRCACCGAKFLCVDRRQKRCARCAPEDFAAESPRTLDDVHRDELRAAGMLPA